MEIEETDKNILDIIGPWSEIKHEIVEKYARAYSTILSTKPLLKHYYIDGFAGSGVALRAGAESLISGSPNRALSIDPPFRGF